jgi:lipoprotein-anchoring transpeptidase ErfK/SrfK
MRYAWLFLPGALVAAVGCSNDEADPAAAKSVPAEGSSDVLSDPGMIAKEGGPQLGAIQFKVFIYDKPDHRADKIGYLRVGTVVPTAVKAANFDSCTKGFYNVLPKGYVCLDDGATLDMEHPLIKAKIKRAAHDKPMPYAYAFLRWNSPRYYQLPSKEDQFKYEDYLEEHLKNFESNKEAWENVEVGANDVPLDKDGLALRPPSTEPPELTLGERFGGDAGDDVPWFFKDGRKIPNVSDYKVPQNSIVTNRIKRFAGVALIDAFQGDARHFALTTDLRLIPTTKLKPARGSTFHGVRMSEGWDLPMAFVKRPEGADEYEFGKFKGRMNYRKMKKRFAYGAPIQLQGEARRWGKNVMFKTETGSYMARRDLAVIFDAKELPNFATGTRKWIDISVQQQVLLLYEGKKVVYATMVSTGRDGLGDPEKSYSTPRGVFRIRDKHVTTTMDSQVVGEEFELNDVPWVQYFSHGYALHAAYWHAEFGRPRSHGCVNLAPIDAYYVFQWSSPGLPALWHGVVASETMGGGTLVNIHP